MWSSSGKGEREREREKKKKKKKKNKKKRKREFFEARKKTKMIFLFLFRWKLKKNEGHRGSSKYASAGNRTRVTSMATMYSATRPLMPWSPLLGPGVNEGPEEPQVSVCKEESATAD